jgi:hypothetical protein
MQQMLGILVVIVAVLGFAMSSGRADLSEPNVATFNVDGLTLSMPIDIFRQLHPNAEVTEKTAIRYCHGEEVKIDSLSRLSAIVRRVDATVHILFDYKSFGQGISTIKSDEVIEFDPSQFTSLRDQLVRHYGPFTGLKYPNKMDPSGLVVGFEWEQKGVAYLSVTIHRDLTDESGAIRQTTFLTRALPGMEDQSIAASYYREVVQNFREKCASR